MAIRETKEGDGYYVEVYLGRDPLTNKKIRKTKTFKPISRNSLKEAKMWEAQMLSSYKTGELNLKGNMKLGEYLDYWFEVYVETNCSYQTQERYRIFCNCIKDHIGYLPLDRVTTPVIDRFYADLKKEMITLKDGTVKRRYKDGTILKTHRLLRQALHKAVGWDIIVKNHADYSTPPEDDKRNISTWSIEEVEKFLELIKDKKIYLPVFIAYHTGLREGEICALKWTDIDFKENHIMVNHNAVQKGKVLELEDPKTETSKDIVVMTKELSEKLKEISKEQKLFRLLTGIELKFVCSWEDGRPLRPLYVTKEFTKLVNKYNFEKITFHGLRHTHASILFEHGATSQEISKRLRHSKVSTTDNIYIHLSKDTKKSTAELFSKAVETVK